jgi:hypothetical protein
MIKNYTQFINEYKTTPSYGSFFAFLPLNSEKNMEMVVELLKDERCNVLLKYKLNQKNKYEIIISNLISEEEGERILNKLSEYLDIDERDYYIFKSDENLIFYAVVDSEYGFY